MRYRRDENREENIVEASGRKRERIIETRREVCKERIQNNEERKKLELYLITQCRNKFG